MSAVRPNPRLAFWLSLAVPGLGLLYAGAPLRGVAVFLIAIVGLGGIAQSLDNMDTRPEYAYYGAIATLLLTVAWWGGSWHARNFAAQREGWPPLYGFFGSTKVRGALRAARVEIAMALAFAFFTAAHLTRTSPPAWLPEVPRYWFLYEAAGALYVALSAHTRALAFFVATLAVTAALALLTRIPAGALAIAYLLALPSCWVTLTERSEEAARLHGMRFAACLLCGVLALFGYGLVVTAWEIASGTPQYKMRLVMDPQVAFAGFGLIYYLLRTGFELLISHSRTGA